MTNRCDSFMLCKSRTVFFETFYFDRLYISHQPSPTLGRGLRVGAHVTVHNVHLCKKGKVGDLTDRLKTIGI